MISLETRIYTYPPIPLADMTPLEKLILTHVLECSETDAGLVLFTDIGPNNPISVKRKALLGSFRGSASRVSSGLNTFIARRVLSLLPAPADAVDMDATVDIDLGDFPWQFVVRDIVARSPTLSEMTVIEWINHPSQRLETYGAGVSLITAKAFHHVTSGDLIARFRLQDRGLALPVPWPSTAIGVPAPEGSRLLSVGEAEAALCIWEAMLYFRGMHEDGGAVPESIFEMSALWDTTGWRAMRMSALEIVPQVQEAYASLSAVLEDGGFTFDFDFVPAVVGTLRWSRDGPYRDGEVENFLESVMATVRRRRQEVAAAALSASSIDP